MRRTRITTTLAAVFAAGVGLTASNGFAQQEPGIYHQGWAPPARVPIQRIPIQYQRYYPQVWYGDPLPQGYARTTTAPMTYVPTDTMQQGYYYQRTPPWQPRPWMIPQPPRPDQWMMRKHEFGMPPTIYNVSYKKWRKHPYAYQGYTHGPVVTPHGYGGYGVPVHSPQETLPAPEPAPADGESDEGADDVTEKTALAPFLTH